MFNLIQIQTTSKCSGNCLICPYSYSWHKKNPGYMTDELFHHILQEIKNFVGDYKEQISPYLMQDPLADPQIIKRIETIFKYFPNCFVEISTNGLLLTEKKSGQLIDVISKYDKTNRSRIWLSHHAVNKETFETLMRLKHYDRVLKNIITYLQINNGQIKTWIRGTGQSFDDKLIYFDRLQFQEYWDSIFKENSLFHKNIIFDYFKFHNRAGNLLLPQWSESQIYRRTDMNCWRYNTGLHILYNGDIVPCCMSYMHDYVWGNIEDQSLKEIWEGKMREDFILCAKGLKKSKDTFLCKCCLHPGG